MSIVLAIILGMIMIFISKVHHYTINEDLSPHSGIKTGIVKPDFFAG